VSRLGRLQPEDKIYWERRFKKQGGIQIVYAKDDFRNDGSIGDILTKVVKHSEAHQYSVKLSEVTLRGAKSQAALGHSAGGSAPFANSRLATFAQAIKSTTETTPINVRSACRYCDRILDNPFAAGRTPIFALRKFCRS